MANPNIVNVTSIYGKTAVVDVTTSAQTLVSNSAGSGKIVKVNVINVANVDGDNAADITVTFNKSGGTEAKLLSTVSVPADSTLVAVSKDTSVYLEEGDSISVTASANGDLEALCSYEEIS